MRPNRIFELRSHGPSLCAFFFANMTIHTSAQKLLKQLGDVIHQLTPDQYHNPLEVLTDSSVGQHVRHTLEFFICLIDGRNEGEINYDLRKHDKVIETDPKIALSVIDSIDDFLQKETEDFPVTFKGNYQIEGTDDMTIKSSFYRELTYNIEHAIHHMALIKIGVKAFDSNIILPDHFGVASSTVRYQIKQH